MPISGIVVSLADDADGERAVEQIANVPQIEVGSRTGQKLAIVVETYSSAEDAQLWNWLRDLPGVVHLDVAFIAFDDAPQPPDQQPPGQQAALLGTIASTNSEVTL